MPCYLSWGGSRGEVEEFAGFVGGAGEEFGAVLCDRRGR